MKKAIFILSAFLLTACAPQATVTPTPSETNTPAPTPTPTPVAIDGIAQDSEGNFLVYEEESQTWVILPKLDAEFDRMIVKEDGTIVAVDKYGIETYSLSATGEWVAIERPVKAENLTQWLIEATARYVSEGGYADWNGLVDAKVLNNPNTAFDLDRRNWPETRDVDYCPYVLSLRQGYVLDTQLIDVSDSPLWEGRADTVRVAMVAFYRTPGVAMIGLEAIQGEKHIPIVEGIYGDNDEFLDLEGTDYEAMTGRLLTFRRVATVYGPQSLTGGYMARMEEVKTDPKWDFFYKTQVTDRSPEARALFEHLVTSDLAYPDQVVLFTIKSKEAKTADIVSILYMMQWDFPIVLADMVADEEALYILYEKYDE